MTRSTHPSDDGRLPVHPLRVLRVEPATRFMIRMLSAKYYGLFTHWVNKRSVYCAGEDCQPAIHRCQRFWKGYTAAEIWDRGAEFWMPVCLELTEHVELDVRLLYGRGQVWEFSRGPKTSKKPSPVHATLLEQCDPKTFPSAFDLVPCLLHLYHLEHIDLTAKNPLPLRTMVRPSAGPAPKSPMMHVRETSEPAPEEAARVRELLERNRGRYSRNGKETPATSQEGGDA